MAIQWNKVTWYSKLIALVLFVALPFVGFWYGTQYGEAVATLNQGTPAAPSTMSTSSGANSYYSDVADWQTDANNTAGGFSIAYPIDFSAQDNSSASPSTDWRLNGNGANGVKYFTLTIPSAFEPGTNFADGTLTVGASGQQAAVSQCLTPDQGGGAATATSSAMINGINFTIFKFSDAAAGSIYETTSYRTLHSGMCYAVEYTIHSSQIANYPPSYNLQPFDSSAVTTLLDRIVGTFKFQ